MLPSCCVGRGTRCCGKSMDLPMDTWRSVEDFRKGGRRRACVVGFVPAARVNITSMAVEFSSRRRKHKHPIEAAAGARLPLVLRPSTHETTRNQPIRVTSQPRAPGSVTHAPSHVLRLSYKDTAKVLVRRNIFCLLLMDFWLKLVKFKALWRFLTIVFWNSRLTTKNYVSIYNCIDY